MIGKVFIKHLVTRANIGITREERTVKQDIVINLTLWLDMSDAANTDSIDSTISYSSLGVKILQYVDTSSFNLLEALANAIADICLCDNRVEKAEVTIEKPHVISSAKSAGVTLIKERT